MTLKKIGKRTTPVSRIQDALKVQAKDYNTLVDAFNAVVPSLGEANADTISEYTSEAGVTVDGVKLQDGMVSMLTTTLPATGSTQTNAAQITSQVVFVTGANTTTGVKLPAVAANKVIFLINTANAVLKVYPASSEKIQGGAANANIALAAYSVAIFGYKAAGDWYATEITAGAVA